MSVIFSLLLVLPFMAFAEETVLISWDFNTSGQIEGWQPNSHLKGTAVKGGVLRTIAADWDPFLVGPKFEIPARAWQCIEVRIRADKPGNAEFFWTHTTRTEHGGFSAGRETHFRVKGSGEWEICRIFPFWHTEKKIIRLRFDLYQDAAFDVDYIRVIDLAPGSPIRKDAWSFDTSTEGWKADVGLRLVRGRNGRIEMHMEDVNGRISSPPLLTDIDDRFWVKIRMKAGDISTAEQRGHGRVWFASDSCQGLAHKDFLVKLDGRFRVYNVDMSTCRQWRGKLLALALTPVQKENVNAEVDDIAVVEEPGGPPVIEVAYFGFADAINRAGRNSKVIATITNTGGTAATGLRATLQVPAGLRLIGPAATQALEPLEFSCSDEVEWTVRSLAAGKVSVGAKVDGPGAPADVLISTLEFTPSFGLSKASYVPEPEPVPSPYDIGVFYFPGWQSPNKWEPIKRVAPVRKPVLGWYDEANPECADWQIKWAVEHGIKFFMVDWYWSQGGRQLEHWLHGAYRKARYRKYLKFCIMWANHNRPHTHSTEDWRKVTQYWIDHYFGMEEYYRIDGRPAVYIWAPGNIRRDLGGSKEATALYALSQQMARDAGYKGIYFVSMSANGSAAQCKELKEEGYEAITSYHGFGPAQAKAGTRYFPFRLVVETSPAYWASCQKKTDLLYLPIVETGWSSEPWHGARARIIHGRTPKLFGELCREARHYADRTGKKIISIAPWNEWGEGSYIEPCAEFGFKMLDELRSAFCEPGQYPVNIAPADVGLGPYDLPMSVQRFETSWHFDTDGDLKGWGPLMGLSKVKASAGVLSATASHSDPALGSPPLRIRAKRWTKLTIRMKVIGAGKNDHCQVFWETPTTTTSEPASERLPLVRDKQFHEYVCPVGANPRWRGIVTRIRFDPCSTGAAQIEIQEIRFE